MSEERDLAGIWAELESLVGEGDFEAAQEVIDDAVDGGSWEVAVSNMQAYLDEQQRKSI